MINTDIENLAVARGRLTNQTSIKLPGEWEEKVDLNSITVNLTEIGVKQNLIVKGISGLEVFLQTNGLPVDCYYVIFGNILDEDP